MGIYITANTRSEIELREKRSGFLYFPKLIRHYISSAIGELFPSDFSPFVKSLLLGDKSDFYSDISLSTAMSRAGIMHVVAVSGMHISFLIGFLTLLFGSSRRTSLVYIIFIWLFVLITGASPSAQRAGLMQSLVLMAPLFGREEDSVTSLCFAMLVILLLNPFAISSISFQLSFGAMAGIILFAQPLGAFLAGCFPRISKIRLFNYIGGIVSSSLSVMVFTVPITAFHFKSLQILSPVTNILVLWAVSLCFCGGFISVFAGLVYFPAGSLIASAVAWPVRYIIYCARLISSVPFSSLYISIPGGTSLVIWIVLVYVLVFLSWRGRKKTGSLCRLLMPVFLSVFSLAILIISSREVNSSGKGIISAVDVGQGQCITVFSGDSTLIIDCGSTGSLSNAGETAGEYLQSCGRYSADALVLTHLHEDHVNGITTLLEYINIENIIIPSAAPDDDGYLKEILSAAESHGTHVSFIDSDTLLTFGSCMKAELYAPEDVGDNANELCLFMKVSLGDYDMLITGDAGKEQELAFLSEHPVNDAELLIAGHHGSKYSSIEEFLSSIGCNTAVISVGYNTYGHPTYETLNALNSLGYDIYRTDLNGTVRIRVK